MDTSKYKAFLVLIIIYFGSGSLYAQTDTVYSMGRQVNRLTWDDVDKHIQRLQIALTNDSIEWLVRYEETHQEIIRDTLFQYGRIHIVDISLLDELDLIEAKLNQKIPDFEFVDLEGDSITSEDLEGKVVLLNFWFTKCPPCIAEMPYLNQIKSDYRQQNTEFISMALEESDEIRKFLTLYEFSFRHIPGAGNYTKKFGVGFPKNLLIDKNGIIRYIGGGIVGGLIEEGDEGMVEEHQLLWDELRIKMDQLLKE